MFGDFLCLATRWREVNELARDSGCGGSRVEASTEAAAAMVVLFFECSGRDA